MARVRLAVGRRRELIEAGFGSRRFDLFRAAESQPTSDDTQEEGAFASACGAARCERSKTRAGTRGAAAFGTGAPGTMADTEVRDIETAELGEEAEIVRSEIRSAALVESLSQAFEKLRSAAANRVESETARWRSAFAATLAFFVGSTLLRSTTPLGAGGCATACCCCCGSRTSQ